MKVKKINIHSYKHLENLSFDFTYPVGHKNVGKPLDKICIIGQCATGKTSILEIIKDNLLQLNSIDVVNGTHILHHYRSGFKGDIEYLNKNEFLLSTENTIIQNDREFAIVEGSGGGTISKLINDGLKVLYFSSEIISKETINIFNQNPLDILSILARKKDSIQLKYDSPNYVYEFVQGIEEEIWFSLLNKILDYRKRFTQMVSELINKGAIGDMNKLNNQYARWAKVNENPLVSFAKYFDPILQKLNLEIDLINTEYSIPIKSKINDEVIPISGLSTGTKGLLLSMFPLFELDTRDSIILLDEPERSLFPDLQIDLITHFQNIAPEAQFIVATHSPFIAAAFEPDERFILYFDEKGKVRVRRGESPIGDDPNDILSHDFNVDYYNDFGKKAYKQYLELKTKVSKETQLEKKKELLVELVELGDKYNF